MTQYWGGTRHFFSQSLNNFKNLGGHVTPSPTLRSLLPLDMVELCEEDGTVWTILVLQKDSTAGQQELFLYIR